MASMATDQDGAKGFGPSAAAIAVAVGALVGLCGFSEAADAAEARPGLQACRVEGVEHAAWCGAVRRPLDPGQPGGRHVDIHFAVLPALARNRKPDPVIFFAGGPGQSAVDLAGTVARLTARLRNRRDVLLIDQRGTGRSAPLMCAEPAASAPLAEQLDPAREVARLRACRASLERLPHGDLRRYTTSIAVQDVDAVRRAVGADRVNLVGGSYGTRMALEYLRQYPRAVRRVVLDGVAPPDMALPAAAAADFRSAFEAVLAGCESDAACAARHPALRSDWQAMLSRPARSVTVAHPATGRPERVMVDGELLQSLVRAPMYRPGWASALPWVVAEASAGRWEPLFGLSAAASPGRGNARVAEGLHFSVVCAEDVPLLGAAPTPPAAAASVAYGAPAGPDGTVGARYRDVCADWPRGAVPAGFRSMPATSAPTLVLSGGADPATPPRHGARTVRALGPRARHSVVAHAGHGVMSIPCMPDVIFRFIDAATDDGAMQVDAGCAAGIPRPGLFVPPEGDQGRF